MGALKSKEWHEKRAQECRDRVRIEGNTAKVHLSQGLEATIDADQAEIVSKYKWFRKPNHHCIYASTPIYRDGHRTTLLMHRLIMGLGPESRVQVDHKDGNGLDNRRSNLRQATAAENGRNRGVHANNRLRAKGVWFYRNGRYEAQIRVKGKSQHLGYFETIEEAVCAYNAAALKYHGAFARLSTVPPSKPPSGSTPDQCGAVA